MHMTRRRGHRQECAWLTPSSTVLPTPLLRMLQEVTLWPSWQARLGRRFEEKRSEPTTRAKLSPRDRLLDRLLFLHLPMHSHFGFVSAVKIRGKTLVEDWNGAAVHPLPPCRHLVD